MASLEEFRKLWPEIAEDVVPEVVESLVEMDRRHWFLRMVSPVTEPFALFTVPFVLAILLLSCSGILIIAAFLLVRFLFPRSGVSYSAIAVPGLSGRIVVSHGRLAVDCYLAGLTYPEISASEAAAAFVQTKDSMSRKLVCALAFFLICVSFSIKWKLSDVRFWALCASIAVICLVWNQLIPHAQVLRRLRLIYHACSLDSVHLSTLSRLKPCSRKDDVSLQYFFLFVLTIIWAVLIVFAAHNVGLDAFGIAIVFIWLFVFPCSFMILKPNISFAYLTLCKDGQKRLDELVEYLAGQTGA